MAFNHEFALENNKAYCNGELIDIHYDIYLEMWRGFVDGETKYWNIDGSSEGEYYSLSSVVEDRVTPLVVDIWAVVNISTTPCFQTFEEAKQLANRDAVTFRVAKIYK